MSRHFKCPYYFQCDLCLLMVIVALSKWVHSSIALLSKHLNLEPLNIAQFTAYDLLDLIKYFWISKEILQFNRIQLHNKTLIRFDQLLDVTSKYKWHVNCELSIKCFLLCRYHDASEECRNLRPKQ
ncbi:hypothetical protein ACKWTF_005762 [Chironomus riparius]